MSIYRTSVNKPVTVALIFLAFAIMGVFALTRLPIDTFPDIESNVIMVMSSYPGASAEDVENNLTKVLENSLNGVQDLKDVTSSSRENISILTLEFEYGTDIDEATNDVRDWQGFPVSVLFRLPVRRSAKSRYIAIRSSSRLTISVSLRFPKSLLQRTGMSLPGA